MALPKILTRLIRENDYFPNNNAIPLLLYKQGFAKSDPDTIEATFSENGWKNLWQDGIYDFHHYHSNTHEVLAVSSGYCYVEIGGPNGEVFLFEKGDVLIVPAGVSHKNAGASKDFLCIGGYPSDIPYDMNYGKQEEFEKAKENISRTPLPQSDPIFGDEGPLLEIWLAKTGSRQNEE